MLLAPATIALSRATRCKRSMRSSWVAYRPAATWRRRQNRYVSVGTANPLSGRLHVVGGGTTAVYADGGSATGVRGISTSERWRSRWQQQFEGVAGRTAGTTSGGVVEATTRPGLVRCLRLQRRRSGRGQSTAGTGVMGTSTSGAHRGAWQQLVRWAFGRYCQQFVSKACAVNQPGASSGGGDRLPHSGTRPAVYGSAAGTGTGVSGVSVTGSGVFGHKVQPAPPQPLPASMARGLGSGGIGVIGEANVTNAVGVCWS